MTKYIFRHFNACAGYILLLCCIPDHGNAQVFTLYDAVSKTVDNAPLLKQQRSVVDASRAHQRTVNGNRLPSLIVQDQLDMGTDNSVQGSYFSLGMVPSTPGSYTVEHKNPYTGNTAIAFLKWDFYTFGYYKSQQAEAKALLGVSEAGLVGDQYQLKENVIVWYLDWLKKYRLMQVEKENMQRVQFTLNAIRAVVASGLKPGVDSSTAGAAFSEARISYLKALDNYNYDRINLSFYTGVLSENLFPDTAVMSSEVLHDPVTGQLSGSVATDHPLLQLFRKKYELQLAGNNVIAKKYLPRLGVDGATWLRSSGISPTGVYPTDFSTGMPYSRYNYLFGLTLTYNLFDLRHRHDELAEGKYLAEGKKGALELQQQNMERMMQQLNSTYANTLERLGEIPNQLRSARQAYEQQLALYRSGLNTLIEVTNAQYTLLQAETNYILAQDEMLQLLFMKAGLAGQTDNFLQLFKR